MVGFSEVENTKIAYDPVRDGVWLHDAVEPVAFIPRNVIIGMIGCLPSNPPNQKESSE